MNQKVYHERCSYNVLALAGPAELSELTSIAECVDSSARERMKDSRALDGVGYVNNK